MTDTSAPRRRIPRPTLRRPHSLREVINSAFFIVAVLILTELALPRSRIDGQSMEPTLFDGQNLLISRVHYLIGDPQRGDIAVFDNPHDDNNDILIKRVIGIPGDTVELRRESKIINGKEVIDSVLYINGERRVEPYFVNRPCRIDCVGSWTPGADEYLFFGDNRNRSNDSRRFNAVSRENIIGKAIWRHWPPDKFGPLD
jgi:signal peptidase I